jgi:hypothetical protein
MNNATTIQKNILLAVFFIAVSGGLGFAQNAGDYRTVASGAWSSLSTWEIYNGSQWVPATNLPDSSTHTQINILSGDTVTVTANTTCDSVFVYSGGVLVVNAGDTLFVAFNTSAGKIGIRDSGTVTVNGTLVNLGTVSVVSPGTMIFNNGATYQHARNGGSIPVATWNTGSTCLLTGITGTAPSNGNQNFYNVVWNCPGQTSNLNLGWGYPSTTTIRGNITVLNTGSGRWQFCAPPSGTSSAHSVDTVNIMGNITLSGAASSSQTVQLTSNGTSNGYTDITINVYGSITVAGNPANPAWTNFSVSRGSQGGTGTTKWNLYGDLSISNATTQNSNTTTGGANFVFAKAGTQSLVLNSVVFGGGGLPIVVNPGSALNIGTSSVSGNGNFIVNPGATLITASAAGLDSIKTSGTKLFSSSASYVYNGSVAQVTGVSLPDTVGNLIIDNPYGVSLSNHVIVSDTLTLLAGNLFLDTNYVVVSAIVGGSTSRFVSTDSVSSYIRIPNVGSTQVLFPVGTKAEGYTPIWITSLASPDTFKVSVNVDSSAALGGGRVKVRWNVSEAAAGPSNCTLQFGWTSAAENASFASNRALNSRIFYLTDTTDIEAGSGSYTKQLTTEPYTVARGGITALGTFGVGNFGLSATLYRSNAPTPTGGNWSNASSWQVWNGSAWTAASVAPTGTEAKIIIQPTDSINVDVPVTLSDTLDNQGKVNGGNNLVFGINSVYQHDQNGGTIPTAKWDSASTCLVTGATSSAPGNANQNFYNFVWNCPGQTSGLNVAWSGNILSGDLVIVSSGNQQFRMTNNNANGGNPIIITIKGKVIVNGGKLATTGSSTSQNYTINHYGDIFVNSGVFYISGSSSASVTWNCYGDTFSVAGGATLQSSNTSNVSKWVFAKADTQSYIAASNVNYTASGGFTFEVSDSSILNMGTSVFGGTNERFILDSAATLITGHTGGLNGSLANGGGDSLSQYATYAFNGAAAQVTGTLMPDMVRNLVINNTNGVVLSKSISVFGSLRLLSGNLILDTNAVFASSVVGGSPASYVSTDTVGGRLAIPNVGSTAVLFPVGTHAEGYSPVWITNSGTVDTFKVSAMEDTTTAPGGGRVNIKWTIDEAVPGGSNCTLQFGWMAQAENSIFSANRSKYARIFYLPGDSEVATDGYTTQFTTQPYTLSHGNITKLGTFGVGDFTSTGIDASGGVPIVFKLHQNYPNPFNPTTQINFTVAKKGMTSLTVYNILGQRVATLFSGEAEPGKMYVANFDGSAFASGVYFDVLENNGQRQVQKMVLLK